MKKLILIFLMSGFTVFGQLMPNQLNPTTDQQNNLSSLKPIVKKAEFFRLSPPLKEMIKNAKREHRTYEHNENEREKNEQNEWHPPIINNGLNAPDPLGPIQRSLGNVKVEDINKITDFDGVDNQNNVAPPDTQGDVSPTHYMQCVNMHTIITDRDGNVVQAAFPTSDFWDGTQYDDRNDGDAVILWDEDAQRWIVTQFYIPMGGADNYLLIAISQTDDPTGQYYQYAFNYGTNMPDYPKWAVWSDAYYMGANGFDQNEQYVGTYVSAFERDKMLQGDANAQFVTFGPNQNLWSLFPADADAFPAAGTPCPFVTDQITLTNGNNRLYIYNFHVDWDDVNNASFTRTRTLTVSNYNLFNNDNAQVPQPGTRQKLDLLHARIMYRPYFRHFNDHESLLVTRTVNDGGVTAIRWYEFRKVGNGNWTIHQQGTYSPGDGLWRWMPSIAMNENGDITIAYSVSDGNNKHPSIRAVARYSDDNLGQMTTNEIELFTGNASQTGTSRWGDYSMVSVDPDGRTFWFTSEYTTGGWNWHTRIIHYELPTDCDYPDNQVTNVQTNVQGENQIDLSWTRGDGDKVIVLVKKDAAVDTNPSDNTAYNADSTFGNGDEIGNGNYVVYNGTGTAVSITGLDSATAYHFAVYEYNTADNCYLTPGATADATTDGVPTVETLDMQQVNHTDAVAQGNVISENGASVTERGVCWSTSPDPTTADSHASNGTGTGTYTVNMTGLTDNTTYYVRAYATNTYGTAYGDNVSFTTGCANPVSAFPYLENFDAWTTSNPSDYNSCAADDSIDLEDCWSNISGDDKDWYIHSGATATNNTGPSDDATGGGNYVYLEANGCHNVTASMTSPYFDLTNVSNPYLSFFINMYGNNNMGELKYYYTTDDGQNWTLINQTSGNQGNEWIKIEKDLNNLAGEARVQFKFEAVTGNEDRSDIALDNFVVKDYTPPTDYCQSEGNKDYDDAITNVTFNQINNSTGKTHAYEDYTDISTVVQRGQSYDLSINLNTIGNYTYYSKVWIDWNQDGDFDDAGEEYDLGSTTNNSNGPTSNSPLSVTIPANAVTGKTRMRVSDKYDAYATACETGFYGEVEDYTVIVSSPNCSDVAYWNGAKWTDKDDNELQPADLSDKLLITKEVLVTNGHNFDACGLSVLASNAVTINTGDYINLTYDVINNGKIDIEDGGILVQSNDAATIKGNGEYKLTRNTQNMTHFYDYAYWSIPIESITLGEVVNNAWRYYSFDAATQSWVFQNDTANMTPGIGYAISAPNGFGGGNLQTEFVKDGEKFNNGNIDVPIYINGTGAQDDDDWNLVGNPYPSPIDFDQLVSDNNNIQGAYYMWTNCAGLDNNDQHQETGYTIYSASGSITACNGTGLTATQFVPVAEGFYVEANAQGNLTFKNTQRSTTASTFVNRTNLDRVWLDFSDNLNFQQILIGFFDNATDQKDRLFDAHSLNNDFDMYSFIRNEKFTIQGLAAWNDTDRIIRLGFATADTGTHKIGINRTEGTLNNVNIFLRDNYENRLINLKTTSYVFQTDPGEYNDRFELIFTRNRLTVDNFEPVRNINLLSGNGIYTVISDKSDIKLIDIYGINGKLLRQYDNPIIQKTVSFDLNDIPRQVLIFKITLKDGTPVVLKGIR